MQQIIVAGYPSRIQCQQAIEFTERFVALARRELCRVQPEHHIAIRRGEAARALERRNGGLPRFQQHPRQTVRDPRVIGRESHSGLERRDGRHPIVECPMEQSGPLPQAGIPDRPPCGGRDDGQCFGFVL